MSGDVSQRPPRSRRSSLSSTTTTEDVNQSIHPSPKTFDANSIHFPTLKQHLSTGEQEFEDRVDFVNLSDENIRELFYSERAQKRDHGATTIVYPSKPNRRTAKQIRYWFAKLGNKQKRIKNEEVQNHEIIEDHDPTIFWDQVARRWTNLFPGMASIGLLPQLMKPSI